MKALADQQAREQIRTDLDRTLLVEAAAGTGKTTELICRMIAVLAEGKARVHEIVAVTFTEKAAGELKLRLRSGLEKAREEALGGSHRRESLESALLHLEEARVSTIHGFCADLLRERPVEARVDPQFQTMTEPEARRLYDHAFDLWLQEKLNDPGEGLRRSLCRATSREDEDGGPRERLRRAGWALVDWRDFPTAWRRDPFPRKERIDALHKQIGEFLDLAANPFSKNHALYRDTQPLRNLRQNLEQSEKLRGSLDYDGLEAQLTGLARPLRDVRRGSGSLYGKGVTRKEAVAALEALTSEVQRFSRAADADLAALLQAELRETVAKYEDLKHRAGRLDFLDLLLKARDLIRDSDAVREDLQRRFRAIFVDEFQDTDPLQAEILLLLAADNPTERDWRKAVPAPGKLFLVGDPKQSIYRFRRADVGIYQEVKRILSGSGAGILYLTTSFRAVPSLQKAINAAFEPVMQESAEKLQAGYVPLTPARADHPSQPSVVVLPVPRPYRKQVAAAAIEESLPDAVGAYVEWLIKSGWTVTERDTASSPGGQAIAPRHICLLFRRFDSWGTEVTRPYVQALEARGIPHLLVGGKSFHRREEVETLRSAATAVEWPDDELSVFATLRGSLFAVGDAELLEYRHRYGKLHPFHIPEAPPESLAPIVEALDLLRRLHLRRNRRPIAETLGTLLAATRAHAGFVLRPAGEQVLANVLHLPELARAYEAAGGISFRGFVEELRDEAGVSQAPEAPILEEGSDGVRLLTVHKAKGLEFPVVILADITAKLAQPRAARYLDPGRGLCAMRIGGWSPLELLENELTEVTRDRAEGERVAYVAATRARDLLVIPAVGDDAPRAKDWWTAPLHNAIVPPPARRKSPAAAPGCPAFGKDSVLDRPDDQFQESNVWPGRHIFPDHEVVWWDPHLLDLDKAPNFTLRQQELLEKVDQEVVERDKQTYLDWLASRQAAVAAGAQASLIVCRATDAVFHGQVSVVELAREISRPAGPRYGTLVHEVLAAVPLDASSAAIANLAQLRGRVLGATAEEIASASTVVEAVLAHPLLVRARAASLCRRETPLTLKEGQVLIEGVVDIAFREEAAWTVLDFKTGREEASYRNQVAVYVAAIAAATGESASGVLMLI